MHHLHAVDYGIIIVYLLATTVIGLLLTRIASKSLDHYFLGNRKMSWWLLGIAGMSNWFDLTGTMIITSFLYMLGPRGLYVEFRGGAVLVLPFLLAYLGKWHRRSGCMTGIEWMVFRYGRTTEVDVVRLVSAIIALASTIFALAYLVRGTSLFLGIMFPYPPMYTTAALVGLTALYTMAAGFYGVVITDLIQGVIIIGSCLIIATTAWMQVPDMAHLSAVAKSVTGNPSWHESLPSTFTPMPKGYEMYQNLLWAAGFYLLRNIFGGLGSGAENRYFGARNDRECGLQSLLQGVTIMFRWPLMAGFAVMGIYLVNNLFPDQAVVAQAASLVHTAFPEVGRGAWHDLTSHIANAPQAFDAGLVTGLKTLLGASWNTKLVFIGYDGIINPEQVLPGVLLHSVPAGMAGFIIVALLAAMKGSLAGMVNGTSAFFVKDIYQTWIRPNASTRELIAASWLSTGAVMLGGLVVGMATGSINEIWGWIIMSLTAGSMAPSFLRLYWWRFNCGGVIGGMVVGTALSIMQFFLEMRGMIPRSPEWLAFLIMLGISFAGSVLGTLLTKPVPIEVLRHFYRTTKPFGLWGPLWKELSPEEQADWGREHYNDIMTVPFGLLGQVCMFLMPMQLVVKSYHAFFMTLPFFLIGAAGMWWFWWRNLPPAEPVGLPEASPAPRDPSLVPSAADAVG